MPVAHASRNEYARRSALKTAVLGGVTLAAIIGITVFLLIHMN